MKKKLNKIILALSILLAFSVGLFIFDAVYSEIEEEEIVTIQDTAAPKPAAKIEFGINRDSFQVVEGIIKPNQFLANLLLPHNIDYVTIDRLAKKSKAVFDVRRLAAGKEYTIFKSKDSLEKAQYFVYQPNAIDYVVYELSDSIEIKRGQKEVEVRIKSVAGVIESSLYETLQEQQSSPALAVKLADIFAWSIDFYRIQKGDWFKAIYEVQYVDEEAIGTGRILAVEFSHFDEPYLGIYFEQEGKGDYFDEEANSLRKAFLKSPLKFSRLSSRYTMRRFHPVQKRWKAHLGTDYAAPTGTPIMSTGDGVVIASSYTRGNGKYVKVKHNSAYTTQYLHMSRRNAKVGQRVKQGDIIGYVGSTGLATGPHVCYRFWKNGKQVDHLKEDFPAAEPIKAEHLEDFKKELKKWGNSLDSLQLEADRKQGLASLK